jgi:hypothetical protein
VSVLRRLLQVNPNQRASVEEIFGLQCVKQRLELLKPFIRQTEEENGPKPELLSTIKLPLNNIRFANFPRPGYGRKALIVKPIGERMHVKMGAPFRGKDVSKVSTPELRMITDEDWWSPEPQTARRLRPLVETVAKRTESVGEEEEVIEVKVKPPEPRKIAFLPPGRPVLPIIRNDIQYKPIGGVIGNGLAGRDPRWQEIPMAPRPMRPQEEVVFVQKEVNQDVLGFRRHPNMGFNPRFRRMGMP